MMRTILLVYIEPTPYILDLLENLHSYRNKSIKVIFLYENLSQPWHLNIPSSYTILPQRIYDKSLALLNLFQKQKYDIVHLAGWGNPWSIFILALAKKQRAWITMESDTPLTPGKRHWKQIIKRVIYPTLFRIVDLFMPGGTRQANYLKHYGVTENRIAIVNMTVDTVAIQNRQLSFDQNARDHFRAKYSIQQKDLLFLFVGRLEPAKGLVPLLSTFKQLNESHQKLLIIGDGTLHPLVLETARSYSNICYAGRLSHLSLLQAYHAADVVVLPSYIESWGLIINEAMAMGKPVIVSESVGCVDDLVAHQLTGLIIKTGCVVELAAAINFMKSYPEKRQVMGRDAQEKIASWTLENEAKKIHQGWDQLPCR